MTNPFVAAAEQLAAEATANQYESDPVAFCRDVLNFSPWSKQREILESVRDHSRTTVRSCHGVGKTAVAARIVLWFLAAHKDSRVITTAPTWSQVEQLLWREIRSAVATARERDAGVVFPSPQVAKLELGERWFAIGLSTNEPERFQGHHADHLLLVVDEASGVDERIYQAAEGFLTAEGAKVLLIGNPTRPGGQFHRSFTTERARWHQVHIGVFDSPNYTQEAVPDAVARAMPRAAWADEVQKAWGEESVMYQVRVNGNFPDTGEDTVISLGAVEDAQRRELAVDAGDSAVIGCDVARFGDDETVIAERIGQQIRIVETFRGKPTTHTSGRVAHFAGQHEKVKIVVDDPGVGGGVTDQLRAMGLSVHAFKGGDAANRPKRFPNRRSEQWFEAAAQMEDIDLDSDEQLAADLTAPRYSYDLKLRQVVEKKEETKKRLGRSPDRADAVLLTLSAGGPGAAYMEMMRREIAARPAVVTPPELRNMPTMMKVARSALKAGCKHRWRVEENGTYCVECAGWKPDDEDERDVDRDTVGADHVG